MKSLGTTSLAAYIAIFFFSSVFTSAFCETDNSVVDTPLIFSTAPPNTLVSRPCSSSVLRSRLIVDSEVLRMSLSSVTVMLPFSDSRLRIISCLCSVSILL